MTRRGACVLIKARFGVGILVHTPCPCDARQSHIGCVFARVRSVTSVNKGPSADAQDAVADTQRPRSAHPVRGHDKWVVVNFRPFGCARAGSVARAGCEVWLAGGSVYDCLGVRRGGVSWAGPADVRGLALPA
jgi:hypothetical protein